MAEISKALSEKHTQSIRLGGCRDFTIHPEDTPKFSSSAYGAGSRGCPVNSLKSFKSFIGFLNML